MNEMDIIWGHYFFQDEKSQTQNEGVMESFFYLKENYSIIKGTLTGTLNVGSLKHPFYINENGDFAFTNMALNVPDNLKFKAKFDHKHRELYFHWEEPCPEHSLTCSYETSRE